MELLVWHAALGCDDEQASDAELCARVLFWHREPADATGESESDQQLRALRLAQALAAFAQRLAPSSSAASGGGGPAWLSVTLTRRRFFIKEVEPQVFMALGIQQTSELADAVVDSADHAQREHRFVYAAVMRDLYGMFRLFHGSIDSNLRRMPATAETEPPPPPPPPMAFADGMELLRAIQTARKRVRKADVALEQCDDGDEQQHQRLARERADAQSTLDALLPLSPATRLAARCRRFFPTLLRALDASHASSLHELVGMGQLAVAPSTFLSLQSFLSAFRLDAAHAPVRATALFFQGNLLWSSMHAPTLQLLYRFLRLREEHGMESGEEDEADEDEAGGGGVWMADKYRDTFRPVWSSKTAYAECAVVRHARRHPRKSARSLHRQSPAPLATVVADANGPPLSSSSSAATAPRVLSRTALKARLKSVTYRNTGLLMRNGYFATTFELPVRSRGRGKFSERQAVDFVWRPRVFALDTAADADENARPRRAVAWHEADLTMLLLLGEDAAGERDDDEAAATHELETLRRLEDAMDRLQFHELAKLLGGSRPAGRAAPAYPLVYRNRADGTFRALQIPRLLRSKDAGGDGFPPPLRLLAHYLPQATLALLDALHAELRACGRAETRDVCVKTLHGGWVLGKRAEATQRELYAFFDTKVPAVADLSAALEDLLQDQLGNVFF